MFGWEKASKETFIKQLLDTKVDGITWMNDEQTWGKDYIIVQIDKVLKTNSTNQQHFVLFQYTTPLKALYLW